MESDPRTNRELPTNYFYFSIRNGIKVFKEQKTRDGGGSLLILKTQIVKERGGERKGVEPASSHVPLLLLHVKVPKARKVK